MSHGVDTKRYSVEQHDARSRKIRSKGGERRRNLKLKRRRRREQVVAELIPYLFRSATIHTQAHVLIADNPLFDL